MANIRAIALALRLIPSHRFPRAVPARGKSTRCAIGNRHEYLIYRRTRKRDERRTSCSEDFVSPFTWSLPRDASWAPAAADMDSRDRPSGVLRKFIYRSLTHESEKKQPACQDIHLLPPLWLKKVPFSQDPCVDLRGNFSSFKMLLRFLYHLILLYSNVVFKKLLIYRNYHAGTKLCLILWYNA